jgi:hypothetical protein
LPKRPGPDGQDQHGELLVEIKIFGSMQRVTVIDPETGNEASASGPTGRGVEQQLTQLAIGKLRRGISA